MSECVVRWGKKRPEKYTIAEAVVEVGYARGKSK